MIKLSKHNLLPSKLVLSVTLLAALAACGGGDAVVTAPVAIALAAVPALVISPTTAVAATASLTAVSTGFTFTAGVPAFGTTVATTVKFTAPATGTATPAFSIASGTGTASGTMSFGSCIFNVTASTIPGMVVGTPITVTPCSFSVSTVGKAVTEGTTSTISTTATMTLGTAPSTAAPITVTVTNSGGTSTVSVNGGSLGTVAGTVTTGASN